MLMLQTLLIIFLLLLPLALTQQSQLLFVFQAFRHGIREPHTNMIGEKDVYGFSWYSFAELTNGGKRMMYALGYETGHRYKSFISLDKFDSREVLIMSGNLNRTVQSTSAFIQGMYPSTSGNILSASKLTKAKPPNDVSSLKPEIDALGDKALPNQMTIAPFHIFNIKDYMYVGHDSDGPTSCKPLTELVIKNNQSPYVQSVIRKYNQDYLAAFKALNVVEEGKTIAFSLMIATCHHFLADVNDGRDVATVLNGVGISYSAFENTCADLSKMYLTDVVNGDEENKTTKLSISKPFESIIEKMQKRIDLDKKGTPDKITAEAPKFLAHAVQDAALMGYMLTFKEWFNVEVVNPKYGSNIRLELHKETGTGKYIVKYYTEDTEAYTVSFDLLKTKVETWKWSDKDIEAFCDWSSVVPGDIVPEEINLTGLYIGLGALVVLFLVLSIAFFILRRLWVEKGKSMNSLLKIKNLL